MVNKMRGSATKAWFTRPRRGIRKWWKAQYQDAAEHIHEPYARPTPEGMDVIFFDIGRPSMVHIMGVTFRSDGTKPEWAQ